MLNEADLKVLVAKLIAELPPEAVIQMSTFVPKVSAADANARPVFAIFVADTMDDLSKCMEVLGRGLAGAIGLSDQPASTSVQQLTAQSRSIN